MHKFVLKKTWDAGDDDLILICGDMNINGNKMTQETKDFLAAKKDDSYKIFSDSRFDSLQEYKAMLWILRGDDFELTDYGKLDTNSDFWEPTFGERVKDEFGEEYPGETALTNDHDYLSE